jgi:NAD-dependent deacetylase
MQEIDSQVIQAAETLVSAKDVAALTGAGISVESGIPPFRGAGGLWEKIDPMEFAHIEAFQRDPRKVWQVLIKGMKEVLDAARPNDAHLGLARLEQLGRLNTIITQNVDGLHQAAGSKEVVEFHGNFAWQQCVRCGQRLESHKLVLEQIPPLCVCGGILRPACVFFGEMIPQTVLTKSQAAAVGCDVMLVVGTSATVYPAAAIPELAKHAGAVVIEINPERTPLTASVSDHFLQGPAGTLMSRLVTAVKERIS